MELELFRELFLSAVISVLFAFLIGKISAGGHGEGERSEDSLATSYLPNSCEILRREQDKEFRNADAFGTGEQLQGEIAAAEERGGGIDLVLESVEEKRKLADQVGEKVEEISEEIPEQEVIERYNAEDLKEEEEKEEVEEKEAESSSSDVKVVRGQGTEIGSRRAGVSTEVRGGSLLNWEDEWEGIETTELEKRFFLAVKYLGSPPGSEALARLSSDAQLELYGLHKIVTEGPCHGFNPPSLKASSRARWHTWQKLGKMAPELAMEQYISLLSKSIPGWVLEVSGKGILNSRHPDMGSSLQNQLSPSVQMKLGDEDFDEVNSATGGLKVFDQGLAGTFLINLLLPTRGWAFS